MNANSTFRLTLRPATTTIRDKPASSPNATPVPPATRMSTSIPCSVRLLVVKGFQFVVTVSSPFKTFKPLNLWNIKDTHRAHDTDSFTSPSMKSHTSISLATSCPQTKAKLSFSSITSSRRPHYLHSHSTRKIHQLWHRLNQICPLQVLMLWY